jgi:type I restriction enzyme S subunit
VHEDFWPLNTSLWVKEFKVATPAYAYQFLKTLDLKRFNAGSAVPTLNRNHVHVQPALLPPAALVATYTTVTSALLTRTRENEKQAESLGELRDTMLPRLISGKLRFSDAEAQLNEALA